MSIIAYDDPRSRVYAVRTDAPLLDDKKEFPPIEEAKEEGLLALGADLSVGRLLDAYSHGIFPWFSDGMPILWWSPAPRFVLFPEEVHVSRSMKRLLKKKIFRVSLDCNFREVIRACAGIPRKGQDGTWLTREMQEAYADLHKAGYAHSVEVLNDSGDLVGGLYGVSLGRMFCGESMFSREPNASKYGFLTLVKYLVQRDFELIDAQTYTAYLESLGARMISRAEFVKRIQKAQSKPTFKGCWSAWIDQ